MKGGDTGLKAIAWESVVPLVTRGRHTEGTVIDVLQDVGVRRWGECPHSPASPSTRSIMGALQLTGCFAAG